MSEPSAGRAPKSILPAAGELRLALVKILQGRWGVTWPILVALIAVTLPWTANNSSWTRQVLLIAVFGLISTGLVISFGYAGELQFGQIAIFAVGAYLSGIVAKLGLSDILVLVVMAAVAASLLGLVLAGIALRLGGWALGMVSFFLVLIIPDLVAVFGSVTGGYIGLSGIPLPTLFGASLGQNGLYLFSVITLVIWIAFCRSLLRSRYGSVFRVCREGKVLASSLGLSSQYVKVVAYTLGAAPAGAAGVLFTFANLYVGATSFSLESSIAVLAAVILGGAESLYGAVLGAAILQLGPFNSASFQQYSILVYGLFLLAVAILLRTGISGLARQGCRRLARAIAGGSPAVSVARLALVSEAARAAQVAQAADGRDQARGMLASSGGVVALEVEGISRSFGGVVALDGVDFRAAAGQITALIGTNGSGKTTLLNTISGLVRPDNGRVRILGQEAVGLSAHKVARLGLARTFQTPTIPRGMSALDVAASGRFIAERHGVASCGLRLPAARQAGKRDQEAGRSALELTGLSGVADQEASALPLGARRLLEVARAITGGAQVMLLDEPAAGLSPLELETLAEVLLRVRQQGVACVLVEHNFPFVTGLADLIYVMHLGSVIVTGTSAEIEASQTVAQVYLGRSVDRARRTRPETEAMQGVADRGDQPRETL
ncbi:MAG TPA: branched-chain amino acid ABC transporter ATP-binding protein/permease [Streptosporangiaceae bacterium]|jgi:branched-chain amino acid transport system permease protein|nr:branched-chain amino acid ABC transporter ATP-binding protein/permease [Streptosporangiaceae bacterium]